MPRRRRPRPAARLAASSSRPRSRSSGSPAVGQHRWSRGRAPRKAGRRLRPPTGARRTPTHRRTVRRATARRRSGTTPADRSATSDSRLRYADGHQKAVSPPGAPPTARTPPATLRAAAAGTVSMCSLTGRSSWCTAANGNSDSDSIPAPRSTANRLGVLRRVVEQGRLADAGFATQHERTATAQPRPGEQLVDLRALLLTAVQHARNGTGVRPARTGDYTDSTGGCRAGVRVNQC